MKKFSHSAILFLFIAILMMAQVDKTQLSLDIETRYHKSFAELSQYSWQRETLVQINNVVKFTFTNVVSIGPDVKPIAQVI